MRLAERGLGLARFILDPNRTFTDWLLCLVSGRKNIEYIMVPVGWFFRDFRFFPWIPGGWLVQMAG